MSNNEQQLRELAPMIDVKSFEAGVKYTQGVMRTLISKVSSTQTKDKVIKMAKESDIITSPKMAQFVVAVVLGVNEATLNHLAEVLERDSKWAIDKLTQYSEGVSDAHVSKLAAAMKGQYQNHNLAPRKNGSAADDDTK